MSKAAAYALLIFTGTLCDLAANAPTGSLPLALAQDGAPASGIALAMGSGMFVGLFASIPIGAFVDRFGRLLAVRAAAFLLAGTMFGLSLVHGAAASGLVMGVRGFALTLFMTAEFAYASELFSKERQATAVATLGMVGNLAFACAPAIGVWLWQHGVGREQYAGATVLALISALALFALPAQHDVRTTRSRTILMRSVWLPAMGLMIGATLQGGVNVSLAVLTFTQRGIVNGALLFSATAVTVFGLRYVSGRMVDRYGPRIVAVPTALAQTIGCMIASRAATPLEVIVAGLFLGIGWSAIVPVGLALLFEKSTSRTRGLALGAYNLSFSIGNAGGALLAALCAHAGGGYTLAILLCGIAPLVALPFVWIAQAPLRTLQRSAAG